MDHPKVVGSNFSNNCRSGNTSINDAPYTSTKKNQWTGKKPNELISIDMIFVIRTPTRIYRMIKIRRDDRFNWMGDNEHFRTKWFHLEKKTLSQHTKVTRENAFTTCFGQLHPRGVGPYKIKFRWTNNITQTSKVLRIAFRKDWCEIKLAKWSNYKCNITSDGDGEIQYHRCWRIVEKLNVAVALFSTLDLSLFYM